MTKLKIMPILCLAGTMDNYAYLLVDEKTKEAAIVDAPEIKSIVDFCAKENIIPKYIFNTHHHFDHTDCNLELKEIFGAKVVGGKYDEHRIPGIDITVKDGDSFMLGESRADIIHAPGHTTGHILWYFAKDKILITGDVLFNLCVGGLFEGTPQIMFESLKKIKALPDDVVFYPGHEYTVHGFAAAEQVCGGSSVFYEYVKIAQERLNKGLPVAPITLGMEKVCNPYLKSETLEEFVQNF